MNILKFLKNKAGKLPVTLAQAAGITAVVGAAGFGAMSFLSSSSDNTTTFLPPSATQEQVVYVSQSGGGGQYEANGEVGSSFKAVPSRSIQLANQEAVRQAQTRALAESAGQNTYSGQPGEEVNPQLPKAYQVSNADLGLGMGGGADKQLNGSLEVFSNIQNQLKGVTAAVNNAQAQARSGQAAQAPGAGAPAETSGQTAAQLASASRNWGNGGLTRAGGGGSGSSNAFVIQNSGRNAKTQDQASAMAQAGDAIAQAQAAMNQMREGSRLQARANFGSSDGLGVDKDAVGQRARRTGQGKDELEFIRKQSAAINASKTNAANEGGAPFLASAKISGGLTVNGDNVTTGTGSSGDLRSTSNHQLKGIKNHLNTVGTNLDNQNLAQDQLLMDMAIMLLTTIALMTLITFLVKLARHAGIYAWIFWAAAGVVTALGLAAILFGFLPRVSDFEQNYGSNGWTVAGYILSGLFAVGLGGAWFMGLKSKTFMAAGIKALAGPALGLLGGGFGIYEMLSNPDKYKAQRDQANSQTTQTQQQVQDSSIEGGSDK